MAKKRKQANETDEQFKKRCAGDKPKPTADERIDNLEKGMGQMVEGMNEIVAKLNHPMIVVEEGKIDVDSIVQAAPGKIINLPDANINIGEISLRRDVALFLQERVKYVLASGQRPGWTAEKEIEMMVKKTMQSAKATTQAEESRQTTISNEART